MVSEFMKAQEFDFTEHEEVRKTYRWGSYGEQGDDPMSVNLLKDLSTNHIFNILRTQCLEMRTHTMFVAELCYRIEGET